MADNNVNAFENDLSSMDVVFVQTALEALKEDLAEMLPDEKLRANAQWHIDLANSASVKLESRTLEFSDDECRVMYIAALEMRDLMNKILDDNNCSEFDREMAKSTLRSCNAMMRVLRKTLIANGIDVDGLD